MFCKKNLLCKVGCDKKRGLETKWPLAVGRERPGDGKEEMLGRDVKCERWEGRGMMDDVRGKRRCFFKTYARESQGGLINIWRFSRVCNVLHWQRSKVKGKGQRAVALGKFHSIDIVGATTGTWNTGESTEGVASGPDERGWRAEKCWERRENFGAKCCLAVLYLV